MQVNNVLERNSIKLDKLQISVISFPKKDVLDDPLLKVRRDFDLQRALKLGNLYKLSVTICFSNAIGQDIETEATIWAVTEKYVMIKGGNMIPIQAIHKVIC